MSIHSIVIIGSGNVATHLGNAFKQSGFSVDAVYSRDIHKVTVLANQLEAKPYTQLDLIPSTADLYLIAVNDSAIAEVANQLPIVNGLVVHTSGTMPIQVLNKHKRVGVFYPLQSLSKNTPVSSADIPVLLETMQTEDLIVLETVAKQCGMNTLVVNSDDRKTVHLAAVFANNFSNYLYTVAEQIMSTKGIPFDILKPLIIETARKVQHHNPSEVQTGPALRKDVSTIEMHLQLLEKLPQYKKIYELLSNEIQESKS
jgi:predicted short-subunit dehydrogenase-like oxidoreductase (DUF2520 family)